MNRQLYLWVSLGAVSCAVVAWLAWLVISHESRNRPAEPIPVVENVPAHADERVEAAPDVDVPALSLESWPKYKQSMDKIHREIINQIEKKNEILLKSFVRACSNQLLKHKGHKVEWSGYVDRVTEAGVSVRFQRLPLPYPYSAYGVDILDPVPDYVDIAIIPHAGDWSRKLVTQDKVKLSATVEELNYYGAWRGRVKQQNWYESRTDEVPVLYWILKLRDPKLLAKDESKGE
jgi:hypothetical protein